MEGQIVRSIAQASSWSRERCSVVLAEIPAMNAAIHTYDKIAWRRDSHPIDAEGLGALLGGFNDSYMNKKTLKQLHGG